jgi:hypothetical protein
MKRIILATALAALFSANVMAATEISSHQADQRGATSYRIIALHEPGDNSTMHVSAELYR